MTVAFSMFFCCYQAVIILRIGVEKEAIIYIYLYENLQTLIENERKYNKMFLLLDANIMMSM